MNNKLRQIATISAKNAVNALLTNSAFITFFRSWQSELTTKQGWAEISHIALACVVGREISIWLPKLFAWSTSATNGNN